MLERISLLLFLVVAACEGDPAATAARSPGSPASAEVSIDAAAAPAVSAHADRLATYKEREHRVPALRVAAGTELVVFEHTIRLDAPVLADAETRLPWIANVDERRLFAGKRALIVPFSVRNDAPVARRLDVGFVLHTRDGKTHVGGAYNERLAAKQRGVTAFYDLGKLPPDTWRDSVLVFDVDPAHAAGAVVHVAHWTTIRDRHDRRRQVVAEHAVVDLAPAVEGPAIRAR